MSTELVPVGKVKDASSPMYKAKAAIRGGLKKAKQFVGKNKAAAIASGIGAAGIPGA